MRSIADVAGLVVSSLNYCRRSPSRPWSALDDLPPAGAGGPSGKSTCTPTCRGYERSHLARSGRRPSHRRSAHGSGCDAFALDVSAEQPARRVGLTRACMEIKRCE